MPKKLSYNYVKSYIEKDNYTLLSDTYKNSQTKLRLRCDRGHEYDVIFNHFQQGHRCPVCCKEAKTLNNKKLSYDYVKQYIEEQNQILLSNSYKNNHTKLKLKCDKGHEYKVTFHNFKDSHSRCPVCKGLNLSKKQTFTYDYVKQYIKNKGYVLLSNTYTNANKKLKLRCDKGHEYEVTFNHFKNDGSRCPFCAGKKKHTYNKVKQYIENQGYTLLSNTYTNSNTKLKLKCNKGHEYKVSFDNFKKGNRCPVCAGNTKHSYDYVKQYIKNKGYVLLSDTYKNANTKLKVKCNKGHEYEVSFNHFKNDGSRCPFCFNTSTSSQGEKEVAEFVKSLLYDKDIICNDRTQIINPLTGYNLELDIWIPELKIAIEYNGSYWHNLSDKKDKIKVEQCRKKGINLLIVEDEKWKENKQLEMKRIEKWIKDA